MRLEAVPARGDERAYCFNAERPPLLAAATKVVRMLVRRSLPAPTLARRGAVLVVALLVVVLVGVLSMTYLQLSLSKNREQQTAADAKRAFYIAEAGIAEAHIAILAGKSGNVANDIEPAIFGAGVYWVKAEDLGNANTCLTSTGLCGSGRACVSIVVQNQNQTVASQGLFSDHGLTLRAGSIVDSYDSRLGSYESQTNVIAATVSGLTGGLLGTVASLTGTPPPSPAAARVGSNGSIHLQGRTAGVEGALVVGDASPGSGGIVERGTGAVVTGTITPAAQPIELPEVPVPPIDLAPGLVLAKRKLKLERTVEGYQALHVENGGELELKGPLTLVVDDLVLESGTTLSIDTRHGPVKVFVRDWLRLAPGSRIESKEPSPTRCTLMCAGKETVDRNGDGVADAPVTVASTSQFYGVLFAPDASFTLPDTFEVFGALAAKSVEVAAGGRVHFDRAFLDPNSDQLALERQLCWRLVQLPPAAIVEQRLDPLLYLKLKNVVPKHGKDAHYDKGATPPTAITKVWKRVSALL